jgi:tetratricopeptide (TPR) repeat protein
MTRPESERLKHMKPNILRALPGVILCVSLFTAGSPVSAQDRTQTQLPRLPGPINLDEALREPVAKDRAASYYYFILSKLSAANGDSDGALTLMKKALDYNRDSSDVHLELAMLLGDAGKSQDAIAYAQEAARLDPQNPAPHWVLARLYLGARLNLNGEFGKAVQELETIRDLDPKNGNVYFLLGGVYQELNEPEKSIQAYEKYQEIARDSDSGYFEIARYYSEHGNPEKAIDYLKKGLELRPDSLNSLSLLGKIYSDLGRTQQVISIYRKLNHLTEDNPDLKQYLASLLYEEGEYPEAGELLEDVLGKNPGNGEAAILLGRVYIEQKKFSKALEILQSVGDKNPDLRKKALFHTGIAYKDNNEFPKAIKIFSDLLKETPDDTEENRNNRLLFQYHLISIYQKEGKNAEAVSIAKENYDRNPENLRQGIFYAQTLADAGETDKSLQLLNSLLESNPSETDLYIHMSQIYIKAKRYREAEKILLQAEEVAAPDEATGERLKLQRVTVYESRKDYDRAESLLKEILEKNGTNAGALNYLGYMLADRGVRLGEAVDYVRKALEIDPENGAYLDSLGWAYFKLNDLKNAETYLLKAGKREKDDPVINDHIGDLYFKTGDYEKARSFWMESMRLSSDPEEIEKIRIKLKKLPGN